MLLTLRYLRGAIALLFIMASFSAACSELLHVEDARLLVAKVPAYIRAGEEKRCPQIELNWSTDLSAFFQVRSHCRVKSASGLIGNYEVDLKTGKVWLGLDRSEEVSSEEMEAIRRKLLAKRKGKDSKKK